MKLLVRSVVVVMWSPKILTVVMLVSTVSVVLACHYTQGKQRDNSIKELMNILTHQNPQLFLIIREPAKWGGIRRTIQYNIWRTCTHGGNTLCLKGNIYGMRG